jgi:hypothetical protein
MLRALPCLAATSLALITLVPAASQPGSPAPGYRSAEQLRDALRELQKRFGKLVRVERYGRSYEKRELWAAEVTDPARGKPEEKPGIAVVAGLRGDDPGSSEVALRMLAKLLERQASDAAVGDLLKARTVYFLPRANPDGMEKLLGKVPYRQRATLAPFDDDGDDRIDEDGPEDVDGDGLVLSMRLRDPEGEWRTDPADKRLLVRKKAGEQGEWRLYPQEGRDRDGDGLAAEDAPGGADLDRNFPALWQWRTTQSGAGPYIASEGEARALIEFFLAHPNIGIVEVLHSTGAQPFAPATRAGGAQAEADRPVLERLGKKWEELTGGKLPQPAAEPGDPGAGAFLDWAYLHFGALAVSPELWRAPAAPGRMPAAGEKEWLDWGDRELKEAGFVPWKPFRHPDLGDVEIGGWKPFTRDNPPPDRLGALAEKELPFLVELIRTAPLVRIRSVEAKARGAGVYEITLTAANQGGTATSSGQGDLSRTTRPLLASLGPGEAVRLLSGTSRVKLGQLAPAAESSVHWTVLGKPGAKVHVTLESQRAGRDARDVTLP